MFPARAGMSRAEAWRRTPHSSVPRASGDEPVILTNAFGALTCSPRERG